MLPNGPSGAPGKTRKRPGLYSIGPVMGMRLTPLRQNACRWLKPEMLPTVYS